MPGLRFDDRLRTALRLPDARLSMRLGKWRQIVDLLVQPHSSHSPSDVAEAAAWLKVHHQEMPQGLFKELNRTFKGVEIPPPLAPFFAEPAAASRRKPSAAATKLSQGEILERNGARQPLREKKNGHENASGSLNSAPDTAAEVARLNGSIFFRSPAAGEGKPPRKSVSVTSFDAPRRSEAKAAFTVRRVPIERMETLVSGAVRPRTGDLVLARVDRILSQSRLELTSGRKAALHAGDEIIIAYGDRYATDQLEARIPLDLAPTNLVATGGVAAEMVSRTSGVRPPTHITPIGLIGDARGTPLNLLQFALKPIGERKPRPRIVAVLGTGMNSGKTTTNRYLIAGLSRAGLRPGAAKITGTGSGGDYWVMSDAGAYRVLDFTDAGYSSTYRISLQEVEAAAANLIDHLAEAGCGVILLEVADGLFQEQNAQLIRSGFFQSSVDGVFFAASDAMGAAAGIKELNSAGIPILGVSGRLTASELSVREAKQFLDVPVYGKAELSDPALAPRLVGMAAGHFPSQPFHEEQARASLSLPAAGEEAPDQVL
ncbi:MAG: hypothetical protein M3177_00650 [Pseudomonadota bacterium]|nr:hypothetical protein [Pseudomonadota bacterium]